MNLKRKLNRRMRILRNLLVFLISVLVLAVVCLPALLPRLDMLAKERSALVGRSTVIDTLNNRQYSEFDRLYVGKTDHGFTFYALYDGWETRFFYREKTGSLTVLAAPARTSNWKYQTMDKVLPVYIFDEYPDAVRAELELTIASNGADIYYYGSDFNIAFHAQAAREQDGFFRFMIPVREDGSAADSELGIRGEALQMFSKICNYSNDSYAYQQVLATVRLYNEHGRLIHSEEQIIRTPAGNAHAARE